MEAYVVELADDGRMQVIAYPDKERLASALRSNIEDEHYTHMGFLVRHVFRYEAGGTMTELTIEPTGYHTSHDEFRVTEYKVTAPGEVRPVVTFSVSVLP